VTEVDIKELVKYIKEYARINKLDYEELKEKLVSELLKNKEKEEIINDSCNEMTAYQFLKLFLGVMKCDFHFDVIDESTVENFLNFCYESDLTNSIYKIFDKDYKGKISLKNSWWEKGEGRLASAREIYPVNRIKKISINYEEITNIIEETDKDTYEFIYNLVFEYAKKINELTSLELQFYYPQINNLTFIIMFIEKLKRKNIFIFDKFYLTEMMINLKETSRYDSISKNLITFSSEIERSFALLEKWQLIKMNPDMIYEINMDLDIDLEGVVKNYNEEFTRLESFIDDYLKYTKKVRKNERKRK